MNSYFSPGDWAIILIYLVGIIALGLWFGNYLGIEGTYGFCPTRQTLAAQDLDFHHVGGDLVLEEISEARLKARPVTTLCIDCKTRQEVDEKVRGL